MSENEFRFSVKATLPDQTSFTVSTLRKEWAEAFAAGFKGSSYEVQVLERREVEVEVD